MAEHPPCSLYPGITAGEAREAEEDVPEDVPDGAILVVDNFHLGGLTLSPKGGVFLDLHLVNPRWVWCDAEEMN